MDKCCGRTSYTPEEEGCCNGNEKFSLSEQKCCPGMQIAQFIYIYISFSFIFCERLLLKGV